RRRRPDQRCVRDHRDGPQESEVLADIRRADFVACPGSAARRQERRSRRREQSGDRRSVPGRAKHAADATHVDPARWLTRGPAFASYELVEAPAGFVSVSDRKSTRLNSSHVSISYAVFCLKKKKTSYTL